MGPFQRVFDRESRLLARVRSLEERARTAYSRTSDARSAAALLRIVAFLEQNERAMSRRRPEFAASFSFTAGALYGLRHAAEGPRAVDGALRRSPHTPHGLIV